MKPLYRNIFLIFGIVALGFMIYSFPDGWETVRQNRENVLIYLPGVVGIWLFVYLLNAQAFKMLVNTSDHDKHLSFKHSLKLTISGFSFSYITPFGFGGGPYRVMELAKYIGVPRAISSVALYSMMHIFSHFFLWTTGCIVFMVVHFDKMTPWLWTLLGIYLFIFFAATAFFTYSYKYGILCKLFHIFFFIPFLRKPCMRFYEKNYDAFQKTDANIRFLYEHPRELWGSLICEYVGRVLNSYEFYFILLAFGISDVTFADALIILAFSSLMGNLLFFLPMQIGAREGSLAVILAILYGTAPAVGVYTSIFTRVREIFWIVIGVALVKIGNKKIMKDIDSTKPTLLFDYGGTLDTAARHWNFVLLDGYRYVASTFEPALRAVEDQAWRDAYVYGERALAKEPIIKPEDNFHTLLLKKVRMEMHYLLEHGTVELPLAEGQQRVTTGLDEALYLTDVPELAERAEACAQKVAEYCDNIARQHVTDSRLVLDELKGRGYAFILVTNFYGNIHSVLKGYGVDDLFPEIVESAVVGVRKPDPAIWTLGAQAAGVDPANCIAIGDSYGKDIRAAKTAGCQGIWYKGEEWEEKSYDETFPDYVITDLNQLLDILK